MPAFPTHGSPSPGTGPLAGVRVLELAGIGPGPYACMLLAEMGADILRLTRIGGPGADSPSHGLARSRPSAAVDLKSEGGRRLALDLAAQADVLIEGNRPGVTERLGLGPEDCLRRNPRLIYGRMTGWGQHGPWSGTPGHDINYAGLTGTLHMVGTADHPMPAVNLLADFGGGSLFLVAGVLAALHERSSSGMGQVVDAAMVDGAASLATMMYAMFGRGRWEDRRQANLLDGGAPFYDTYRCSDGKHVAVGAIEPQFYRALLAGLGLTEAMPGDQHSREHWPRHREILSAAFATRPRDDWARHFEGTDACVTPVLGLAEAPTHPHLTARGTFVEIGGVIQPGPAPRFSRTPLAPPRAPHDDGADTVSSLQDWGVAPEVVRQLLDRGEIRQGETPIESTTSR